MAVKTSRAKYAVSIIAALCILIPFITAAPAGLSQSIFQVLGITVGGLLFWLFVSIDWPNLLVILGLMLVPELGAKNVIANSLGNSTVFFLTMCFLLSGSLVKTGVARRVAIWFITCRTARRGPWHTINMIFISVFVLASLLSATATLMIFLPILYIIFNELGYTKEEQAVFPAVMVCGIVVVAQIAQAATPISHAMTIIGMSTFNSYTGETIDFLEYCALCLPIALASLAAWCVLCRFVFRPETSRLTSIDYDAIKATLPAKSRPEAVAAVIYIAVIISWALPGIGKYLFPNATFLAAINQNYVPIIGIVLLQVIKFDGQPVYGYKDGLKAVPWSLVFFMGAILALGSAFGNADIGMSAWLSGAIGPSVSSMSPVMFLVVITCVTMLLTNVMSNAVCIAVMHAVAMPLAATVFAGRFSPALVSMLITTAASYAFATPPATPPAAIAADSGWLSLKRMLAYGLAATVCSAILACVIGIPLGSLLCR